MADTRHIDYLSMGDAELAAAWRAVDSENFDTDYDGTVTETLNFVEDAILQRIGAPEHASGDEQEWQEKIRAFGGRVDTAADMRRLYREGGDPPTREEE